MARKLGGGSRDEKRSFGQRSSPDSQLGAWTDVIGTISLSDSFLNETYTRAKAVARCADLVSGYAEMHR
jgi:hypothetical protein